MFDLDSLITDDHRARSVLAFVSSLDLSKLYAVILAVVGQAGAPKKDPMVLLAVWLFATLEGIGSARRLEELCQRDHAYLWLCGGLTFSHRTLSGFRMEMGSVLDDLLTQSVAVLVDKGLVDLDCLAVDGMRLRAHAGASSFRRRPRLEDLRTAAQDKVKALRKEIDDDPAACSARIKARQERAARERAERLEKAVEEMALLEAQRQKEAQGHPAREAKRKPPRTSTTDPEARIMKMGDGGFRPAYNVQFKSDPKSGVVTGIDISNQGSDRGMLASAVEAVEQRYDHTPDQVLADGGYDAKDDIEALHEKGVAVFCPVPVNKDGEQQPEKKSDGPGVKAWRERMAEDTAKAIHGLRALCERMHGDARNRNLVRVSVCGKIKVKAAVLWFALANNFLQSVRLLAAA